MPYKRSSIKGDRYICPVCGKEFCTPYYIYEPHEETYMLAQMFGRALDHIAEEHTISGRELRLALDK